MNADESNARAVAYLDLLGFSAAAKNDPASAIRLMQDYSDSLHLKRRGLRKMPPTVESKPEMARLAHLMAATSFETFLPMSDSVFIVSSTPGDLVLQLSDLLWDCLQFRWYAFMNPEDPATPTTVTTKAINITANETTEFKETWLPVLFRGGVVWGRAQIIKAPGLNKGEGYEGRNVIGEAVVSAVALGEQKLKGPRVVLSDEFVARATTDDACPYAQDVQGYIADVPERPGTPELLWPIAAMATANGLEDALNNDLGELIRGALNLLVFHIADMSVVPHYHAFLALIVRSAIHRFGEEQRLRQYVSDLALAASETGIVADAMVAQAFGGTA